jgi:hypothetical protein
MTLSSALSRLLPSRARVRRSSRWQQRTFAAIHEANPCGNDESVSGPGSTIARGADFQHDLLARLDALDVRSLLGRRRQLDARGSGGATLAAINERCFHSEGIYRDKRLGLWRLETIDV